ncbi:hypothetical protein CEXT_599271 [Caerostris extrusa]|uniref:Uncharacterized protein n=1 Tax=Caerostris extrusa TaxID=172846 RepID=A0AAV4P5Y4_CAEEX|nr:hypothetical protein CEXT_599271 [Caerostris extrusa]
MFRNTLPSVESGAVFPAALPQCPNLAPDNAASLRGSGNEPKSEKIAPTEEILPLDNTANTLTAKKKKKRTKKENWMVYPMGCIFAVLICSRWLRSQKGAKRNSEMDL